MKATLKSLTPGIAQRHFEVRFHGTTWTMIPLSKEAQDWILQNVETDAYNAGSSGFYCEPRQGQDILDGFFESIGFSRA